MPAPQVPQFDKRRFPDAPWLSGFWELLNPFFQAVSEAIGADVSPQVLARDLVATTDASKALAAPVVAKGVTAKGLVLVTAERLDAQGRATGEACTAPATYANTGGGLQVTALIGLAASSRYRLTVWVVPG